MCNKILIIIAGLGLLISFLTIYYNFLRGPRLRCYFPSHFSYSPIYNLGNGIMIYIPITLLNDSNTSVVIIKIAIAISKSNDPEQIFYMEWNRFFKVEPHSQFHLESNVYPLSLVGRNSITKIVGFLFTCKPAECPLIDVGSYSLNFLVWKNNRNRPFLNESHSFRIDEDKNTNLIKTINNSIAAHTIIELSKVMGQSKTMAPHEFDLLIKK